MPKFRYAGDEPRIYSELPFALGEVHPGAEFELDSPPDFRWEGIGSKAKAAAKAVAAPAPAKAVKAKPAPAPEIVGVTEPLAQPEPSPEA